MGFPNGLRGGCFPGKTRGSLHCFTHALSLIHISSAVQDALNQTARGVLFASVKDVVTGTLAPEEAIETALATPLADS